MTQITDEMVEKAAKSVFDMRHSGLKNCFAWDDPELDTEHPDARDAIRKDARVALTAALQGSVGAWAVTQSGEIVSLWITEEAAVKVMASYRRNTKGAKWDVEPVTLTRMLPRQESGGAPE